jgi:regulator of protease activity HflC (stomatin/prohibitin superfamily)
MMDNDLALDLVIGVVLAIVVLVLVIRRFLVRQQEYWNSLS